ncbi:MAG: alpha/beta hydrolase [Acidobacteriota bacterium]
MTTALEYYVAATRQALTAAGLERMDEAGRVFWRGGRGEKTIVLLHGVNDQAGTWAPVVAALMASHKLLVLDLSGHGDSEPHEGALPISRILSDLHAVIEAEAPAPVTLVGNSMGGWVSMLYALVHPDCVERLVLEDGSGMSWPVTVPLLAQTREQAAALFRAANGPSAWAPDEALDALVAWAAVSPLMRVMQGGILDHLLDDRLGELDLPVTMIWGADDGLLPVAYAEALRDRIRGARLHVIEGAAHIPHRQRPERFLECLLSTS